MVIIDIESNTSVGGLTLDPAGMHCPSWDDAFVSSSRCNHFYCCIWLLPNWHIFSTNYSRMGRVSDRSSREPLWIASARC